MKKNHITYSILALIVCFFQSCVTEEVLRTASYLDLSTKEIILSPQGGSMSFDVSSDGDWMITGVPDWLSVDQKAGVNNGTVSFSASVNTILEERTVSLVVKAGTLCKEVKVTQENQEYALSDTSFRFPIGGGSRILEIQYPGNWSLSSLPSWVQVDQKQGRGNGFVELTISKNNGKKQRRATLLLSIGLHTEEINITQSLADVIVETPGNLQEKLEQNNLMNEVQLAIEGLIDCNDINVLRTISNLRILKMKDIRIEESTGWVFGNYVNCPKDGLPDFSFRGLRLIELELPDSLKSIGSSALSYTTLINLVIPDQVKSIGDWAFSGCHSLESMIIPASVEQIGESAFYSCENLESMIIHGNITEIKKDCFLGCSKMTTLILPNSLVKIEDAFSVCYNLKTITLPPKLKEIENNAFSSCRLEEIHSKCIVPPTISKKTFWESYLKIVYVPRGSLKAYQSAPYWSNFTIIEE